MNTEQITVDEAIKRGYKYCTPEYEEMKLIPLSEVGFFKDRYILVEQTTRPYQISDSLISELVDDYLCNQDEVADDTGFLNDIAATIDYSDITKKLNGAFANKTNYYFPSNIRVIPNKPIL